MGLNELREKYLSFFESKEHLRLPSFSLVPQNDKSLLLINSGMAPMKKYFTGEVTPPRKRVTTCQKCIRTPDIERVGITARHGTFFEMLGNFSFGDYFKREAIAWSWEFFTKTLGMPADRIYCSVYENDDEAYDIWTKEIGVKPDHMKRLGKEDNFWEHGSGPCGPCSEIYFDRGEKYGCGKPDCGVGCDCDRFVEVWNNVFSQFNNDGNNNYTELAQKNIDTGMGLERLACVMQGVDNLFLVDTIQNIMKEVSKISGVQYGAGEKTDISLRVITDHIRSTTFMISDGVMPSNAGRGYVLRRLLRRAARHGRLLGIDHLFLSELCDTAINESKSAYPELEEKRDFIKKVILHEEESFARTIDQGLSMLNEMIEQSEGKILSGEDAFRLNDTFGFPIDLTKEILAEKEMSVDEAKFYELLQLQKDTARASRKKSDGASWASDELTFDELAATKFVGYTEKECQAEVLDIVVDGAHVTSASEGDDAVIVLCRTPFYAESGGQIGDTGVIESDGASVRVSNTTKNHSGIYLHQCVVLDGEISVGEKVTAKIDSARRDAIMRNHTAAHLIQAALRKVLGNHVEQAGQLVSEERVRFDFTHFSALTAEELQQVETLVNEEIMKGITVTTKEMPIEEAKKMGAMALFGEIYGDVVRVVRVEDDFSIEFCGGTHANNTARLGLLKIVSESSAAAGVRRIEAVTGLGGYQMLQHYIGQINETAAVMKVANTNEVTHRAEQLMSDLKAKDKEIDGLRAKIAEGQISDLVNQAQEIKGVKLVAKVLRDMDNDSVRSLGDKLRDLMPNGVSVLACVNGAKATIAVAVAKEALAAGAHAGNLVREVAKLAGGNGGGRPDSAMAGAKDISKLDEAVAKAGEILAAMLK